MQPRKKLYTACFLFILLNLWPVVCLAAKQVPAKDAVWVNQVFQKGKTYYESGDYKAAVKEWDSLNPYLDQYPSFKKIIDYLKTQSKNAPPVTAATLPVVESPVAAEIIKTPEPIVSSKPAVSSELSNVLSEVGEGLKADLKKLSDDTKTVEEERSAQETWIESTFQKGKAFYEQGEVERAIAEWDKMTYKLDAYPEIKAKVQVLKEAYQKLRETKSVSADFTSTQYAGLKVARRADMLETLSKADRELRGKSDELMDQKRGMERSIQERRDWINLNFEKGRELYKANKYREAFDQWRVVAPYLENEAEMRSMLASTAEALKAYEVSLEASRALLKSEKIESPEGMKQALADMLHEMAIQTKKLEAQRAQAENVLDKRDADITAVFDGGKALYAEGKIPEAVLQWKKLVPMMEDGQEVTDIIAKFEEHHKKALELDRRVKELSADKARYTPPADLSELIERADKDLRAQIESSTNERLAMEQGLKERDLWIQETLQKAKAAFDENRLSEAIDGWNKLVSYLDAGSEERAMLERLKKNYFDAEEARKQNKQALDKQGVKLQLPEAFKKSIEEANKKTLDSMNEIRIEREAMQRDIVDRQAWIVSTYQRGKSLYDVGRLEEALAEWKKLPDHLDDKSNVSVPLAQMESALRDSAEAKRALTETEGKKAAKFSAPEGLSERLQKAAAQLNQEAAEASEKRDEFEKDFADRQAWIDTTTKAGKIYYDQGKLNEAAEEWEKLAPYIQESSPASQDIRVLKESRDRTVQAKKEAVETMAMGYRGLQMPNDLSLFLRDMTKKLETETLESQRTKAAAQQALSEKQRAANLLFEKGKLFYQNGDVAKAVEQWVSLVPILEPSSAEARQLDILKLQFQDWDRARKALQGAQNALNAPVAAPTDLAKVISEALGQMKSEAQQADIQRKRSEQSDAARHAALDATFARGRIFYLKGDLAGALEQWSKVSPSLDEASAKLVADASRSYLDLLEAQKNLEMAEARRSAKLATPPDLSKALEEITQKTKVFTQQALGAKEKAEQVLAERQTQLAGIFEKGRLYYQAGDLTGALGVWTSMISELSDTAAQAAIQDLDKTHREFLAAQRAMQESQLQTSQPVPAPEGLLPFLQEAQEVVTKKQQQASFSRASMEKTVADREAAVRTAFQNAKVLLAKDQWREALLELDKMSPYLDERSEFKGSLQNLKKASLEADAFEKAASLYAANEYKTLKMPFADELTKLLSQSGQKFQADILQSKNKKDNMEKALAEREAWARMTFEKGKVLYSEGKFKEALDFWSTLSPFLQNEAAMKALMASLTQSYESAIEAEKVAQDAEARKQAGVAVPAEMPKLVEQLSTKLKTLSFDAKSRKEKSEQDADAREAEMLKALHHGADLAATGNYSEALKTWSTLPAFMQDPPKTQALLDSVNVSYQTLDAAKKSASEAEALAKAPLAPPKEIADLLTEAVRKLEKESQVTDLGRQRADKVNLDREEKIKGLFTEGKLQYDQGRLNAAFLTWRGLLPFISDERELEEKLTAAEESYQKFIETRDRGQEALAKKEMKLTAPAEVMQILDLANRSMGDQVFDMKNKTMQTEKMVTDRKNWVEVTFQKGKLAYTQGRYKDAIGEWRTLLPFIENGERLKDALDDFERNLQLSLSSSKVLADAGAKKDTRFAAPEELAVLLTQLNEKVKNEALEATAEKVKAEQIYFDRQKTIQQAFQQGRLFYEEGRFEDALAEWDRLAPYLDAQSGMQKLLEAVKQSYRESLEAKKGAVEAAANDYKGLKLPYAEQMTQLLMEADKKMKEEAGRLDIKKREVEKTMAERQEWSVTTFNKGKIYFEDGQYEQALGQWERLLPYLPDSSGMKQQLQRLRENYNIVARNKAGLGSDPEAGAERSVMLKDEGGMVAMLNEANDKMKANANEVRAKADVAQKEMQDRREWIEYTFEQGKKFYDDGNYAKAVEQWGLLGPYLGEHPKVREAIDELKKNHSEIRMAQKVIESVEAKKPSLLPLPAAAKNSERKSRETVPSSDDPAEEVVSTGGQLVSGEIVSIDETQKTMIVKVFTSTGKEETLTVNFDDKTQVDGSMVSMAAVQSGATVELRYNPETSRALYVYIY